MAEVDWGSIADWVSGIGSLAAAVVALYVAHSSQRVKIRGYCGHRLIIGGGRPTQETFTVSATNISQRPTVITGISLTFGIWRWKQHGILNFLQDDISQGIPRPLNDGETGTWSARIGEDKHWIKGVFTNFKITRWSIFTWRVHIHTSNGGSTTLRPEKNIRDMLIAHLEAQESG